MKFLYILFVVLCGKIYSQEISKNSEIFKKDNLVYDYPLLVPSRF
jgi:hypothetical protein